MTHRRRFARVPTRSSTARRRRDRRRPPEPPAPAEIRVSEALLFDRDEDLWGGSSLELELPQALLADRSA